MTKTKGSTESTGKKKARVCHQITSRGREKREETEEGKSDVYIYIFERIHTRHTKKRERER